MQQQEYLQRYEDRLSQDIEQMLRSRNDLPIEGPLPQTPDISEQWLDRLAPSYCADAVKEIAQYPLVALGWAMYLGMAMARYWDDDWATYGQHPNLYLHLRDVRGFDYMDEVVRTDLFGYKPLTKEYDACEELVRSCAQMANDQIRHEQIEPSTPLAFHVFARSIKVLYLMGAAVGLTRLGYKNVRV